MLDALMPRVRQRILAALTLDPDRRWYQSELARYLQLRPSSLQRELDSLAKADIVLETKDGNRVYIEIKKGFPLLPELQRIFAKTIGIADSLKDVLGPLDAYIDFAFIFGSVAKGERTSDSDIDVLVIGTMRMADISKDLSQLEAKIQAPVSLMLFSREEFEGDLARGNHFLLSIWNEPKIWLKGSDDEFAGSFAEQRNQGLHNQQA